jgi:hypothetical protein
VQRARPPKDRVEGRYTHQRWKSNVLLPGRIVSDEWIVCLSMDKTLIVLLSEPFPSNTTWTFCSNPFRVLRQPHVISAHYTAWKVPYKSQLDKALVACDEISGLIVACCLMRPDGILSLNAASVMRKLKERKFAAGVDRGEILAGVQLLNVNLTDHITFVIDTLRPHAANLGIDGALKSAKITTTSTCSPSTPPHR